MTGERSRATAVATKARQLRIARMPVASLRAAPIM